MNERISGIFDLDAEDDQVLTKRVEENASRDGDRVYRETLMALTGKDFEEERARHYWQEVLRHQGEFFPSLPAGQRLRPALLHYLHQVAWELHDPRIVEADQLENLKKASSTDGLTGLFNQTYFKAHLEKLLSPPDRSPVHPFAVILFDLDRFKQYNDRCGHLAGDQALGQVAEIIRLSVRQGDVAARYGGEEFAFLLHRLNAPQAFAVAERMRSTVEAKYFQQQELLDSGNLTISGGIALYPQDGTTVRALLEHADRELYEAKKVRNLICPQPPSHRRSERRKMQSVVEFAFSDQEFFFTGMTFDISPKGIAIGCEAEIQPGTPLNLRFRRPFWPVDRELRGTVRNIRRVDEGGIVRLGLEFNASREVIEPLLPKGSRGH